MIWLEVVLKHCQPIRYLPSGDQYVRGLWIVIRTQLFLKSALALTCHWALSGSPFVHPRFSSQPRVCRELAQPVNCAHFPGSAHIISVYSLLVPNRITASSWEIWGLFSFILYGVCQSQEFSPVPKQVPPSGSRAADFLPSSALVTEYARQEGMDGNIPGQERHRLRLLLPKALVIF